MAKTGIACETTNTGSIQRRAVRKWPMAMAVETPRQVPRTSPRQISNVVMAALRARAGACSTNAVATARGSGKMNGSTCVSHTIACHANSRPTTVAPPRAQITLPPLRALLAPRATA